MSSVDPEANEEGHDTAAKAEELKNTANQFFKGRILVANLKI